jgi:hypothetical protein
MMLNERVRAHRPAMLSEGPGWVPEMDKYAEAVGITVTHVDEANFVRVMFDGSAERFWFNVKWLTKLSDEVDGDALSRLR